MKKMLIAITTVGVLAVPAGMALAQSDPVEPDTPVPTCVDPERDRDRDRSGEHDMLGPVRTQLRDGDCAADCTGDHAQTQNRVRTHEQTQLADGPVARNRIAEKGNADNG
jgi:hypothetical protein